jgi:hypothetical protein
MTNETRKAVRAAIIAQLDDDSMPLEVGGHKITNQLVYAGCSQWSVCDRDWDESCSGYAWIVDGQWQLTFPRFDHFDGNNQIERQSKYYLQPDRAENPPSEPIGEPLLRVPDHILLDIGKALSDAVEAHKQSQNQQDAEAMRIVGALSPAN